MIGRFDGQYAFLSNFDPTPFQVEGEMVKSGEHLFNSLKTTIPAERQWVLDAPTPGKAKYRGRGVTLRPGWDEGGRVAAMQDVVRLKFGHPELRTQLLATGHEVLVEGNRWHDNFWGRCNCPGCAGTNYRNMLGELLMAERSRLA